MVNSYSIINVQAKRLTSLCKSNNTVSRLIFIFKFYDQFYYDLYWKSPWIPYYIFHQINKSSKPWVGVIVCILYGFQKTRRAVNSVLIFYKGTPVETSCTFSSIHSLGFQATYTCFLRESNLFITPSASFLWQLFFSYAALMFKLIIENLITSILVAIRIKNITEGSIWTFRINLNFYITQCLLKMSLDKDPAHEISESDASSTIIPSFSVDFGLPVFSKMGGVPILTESNRSSLTGFKITNK